MAVYRVEGPDGSIHKFEGPEGATPEEIEAAAQEQFGGQQYTSNVPSEMLGELQPSVPPSPPSLPEGNALLRYPMAAAGTAVGLAQGAGAGLAGNIYGLAKRVGGASPEEAERAAQELSGKLARQPSTQAEAELTGRVGDVIGSLPPVLGGSSAQYGLVNPAMPQVLGLADKGLGAAARAVIRPSPEALALASKARDFGIELPPTALSNSKLIRTIGEAAEHIPLSFSGKEARGEAFNKALIKQIGGDPKATRLTPDVFEAARSKYGTIVGDTIAKNDFPINKKFFQDYLNLVDKDIKNAPVKAQEAITRHLTGLLDDADQNHNVPGSALHQQRSSLLAEIRDLESGANPDMNTVRHLRSFQKVIDDQLFRQMSKADRQKFIDASTKYAKAMTIEPLVAKATGTEGMASPAGLMSEVAKKGGKKRLARGTSGEMGDLAAIGQRFLKEPVSSGAAERNFLYRMLEGAGGIGAAYGAHSLGVPGVAPVMGGAYGLASLYNKFGPSITNAMLGPRVTKSVIGQAVPKTATGGLSIVHPPVVPRSTLGSVAPLTRILPSSQAFPMLPHSPEVSRLLQAEEED